MPTGLEEAKNFGITPNTRMPAEPVKLDFSEALQRVIGVAGGET